MPCKDCKFFVPEEEGTMESSIVSTGTCGTTIRSQRVGYNPNTCTRYTTHINTKPDYHCDGFKEKE